ncbi:MAG: 2-oxo acid dehydrogenase subunit E2 [Deltaproteobacteria bacterium]|nr:2-oxo acid dehydrogenase subunit E2 [Deltaproteobacteria bacterium]
MAENVLVPSLGTTVKNAKITRWLYSEGQPVEKGAVICEIETEKVNYQIEAPISGILSRILASGGQVVKVAQTIGVISAPGEAADQPSTSRTDSTGPGENGQTLSEVKAEKSKTPSPAVETRIKITPIARKMAQEKGIDISRLKGSGPGGRIVKADVLDFESQAIEEPKVEVTGPVLGGRIPLTTIRSIIGERLTQSSRDVPHVYFACEVDCTALIQFRNIFKPILEQKTGLLLSFNDLLIKAVSMTIEKYPLFNATLENKTIKIPKTVDIGLAMAMEQGLLVPVIRKTNLKSLSQIMVDRVDLVIKAQSKRLTLDELSGSTFTISNLGQFDIDFFVSIINPPETAILSVAKIKERPVVADGVVVVKPIMNLGLSADHRVVDGADAARFLQDLKNLLEQPFGMCSI